MKNLMRHKKIWLFLAMVLACNWTLGVSPTLAQVPGVPFELPGPPEKEIEWYIPTTFGPIITDTAIPIDKGKFAIQPTFGMSFATNSLTQSWRRVSAGGDFKSFGMDYKFTYGLCNNLEVFMVVPVFQPLGFNQWQAASSLLTGFIAKEIVVTTMGQIYGNEAEKKEEPPALGEEVKEIGLSFGKAVMDAGRNVVSTFGVATLSIEDDEKTGSWRGALQAQFSPLSALAFMAFTLLYMPCVVTAAAFKHE